MTELASRIAQLSDEQRKALFARVRAQRPPAGNGRGIVPIERDGDLVPLSFTQERIWFLEQFTPGTPFHNMSGVARIPVPVSADILAEALSEVVTRHEVLRTRFVLRGGEPAGIVADTVQVPLRLIGDVSADERERLFLQDAQAPFDVATGPLLRASLAPAEGGCYIQLTMHHLVSDGFSNGVFFREVGALCAARLTGTRAKLQPVPFQFADYAAWERDRYARPGQLDFWAEQLRDAPGHLALPTTHPRPARMTYRGGRLPFELPADLVTQVRAVSAAHGVTPFVTMLAAYAVVLARFSAQDEVVVGVPVANREMTGTDQLIGPFLNTIALRVQLAGDDGETTSATVAGLLKQVNRAMLGGYEYQGVPFERVLSAVQPRRDPARSPLFQVVMNYQADRSDAAGAPGVELSDIPNGGCQFDLLLNVVTSRDGMRGHLDYYADAYDKAWARRLLDSYLCALRALADGEPGAGDSRPVAQLPLLPSRDVALLAERAAGERVRYADDALVPDLVLAGARRDPHRVAIVTADRSLSYGELDAESAALAAYLRSVIPGGLVTSGPGAQAGRPHVAICLPRSLDMIVAILGVLRAGFAYVPLDPAYPRDRLAFICGDASIAAVITRSELHGVLPDAGVPGIDIDRPLPAVPDDEVTGPLDGPVDSGACAYTIYTSGSTGVPKGVQVSHRNVVNFLESMRAEPGLTGSDVLLAVTSPSFDIAVLEMLLPLLAGGTVVVAAPDDVADGRRLAALLDSHGVTVMQATPTTWQLMVESGWRGRPGLRALCGGEAFPPALAGALLSRCAEVWNMYGPTETTIWSAIHQVTDADVRRGVIPIGRPISNTSVFVLDQGRNPVPPGVTGELCIGGDGVAIGYHHRPELTGDRFVTAPFLPEHRLYRTGDLVRTRDDGVLEYLGRSDSQVKIRGFRIELGEIEAVLESHPGVARAVAVVRQSAQGDNAIVAYVQTAADADVAAIRDFLRERLPEHMIPARFVTVAEFPLTPNGKIDRKSLPEAGDGPAAGEAPGASARVPPRTDAERTLAAIWQDLLNVEEVGVQESFFDLGGHSLLATKLAFRVREAFDVEVPLMAIFEGATTIERLAGLIEGLASGAELPAVRRELDLAAEARLADDIHPAPGAYQHAVRHPENVLFTGATGFVGAFLLDELLRRTEATAFCLVRASAAAEGLGRIRDTMTKYGLWDPAFTERIIPVIGTLSDVRFGLSRAQWQHLAAMVNAIYHCGAEVNFLQPYQALKPVNVSGTEEILRFACDGPVKPVHFISTTYVFARFSYPPGTEFTEDMRPYHDLSNTFGYTQSKWVSEQLVLEAGRRGLPVWVFRASRVAGHRRTGAVQTYDFMWQATRLGIEMGVAPIMDMAVDITPVDYVAEATVHLSRQPELRGQAFHVVSQPIQEPDLVAWLEGYGYRGQHVSFGEWCRRVMQRAAELDDESAGPLAPFLSGVIPLDRIPAARFDDSNVRRGLAGTSITCPAIDDKLLRTYIDYFVASGYLPEPTERMARARSESARAQSESGGDDR